MHRVPKQLNVLPRRPLVVAVVLALAIAAVLAPLLMDATQAGGSDMRAARAKYPGIVGTNIDQCSLCHVSTSNYRLDPYGDDYERAGGDFASIENDDSDNDGFTNIEEINARTFPGKADSVPTVAPTATTTVTPTATITATATVTPTHTLSPPPTDGPTQAPTDGPTQAPTAGPTDAPTVAATATTESVDFRAFLPWCVRP